MDTNLKTLWTERISAYQSSGQTMKHWCTEHGLAVHQLKYWLYKAQRRKEAVSTPIFLPVTVASPSETDTIPTLQIQVGVAQIEIRRGFEPELLRDVVAALTPLC